jgi:hypothetical protein
MIRFWPTIPAGLGLLISVASANAAPLRPELTTASPSMIEKVHGVHRTCGFSSALGWHRHFGAYNRVVSCGSPYYYYDDPFWDSPGLYFWFGPGPRYYHSRPYRTYRFHRGSPRGDGGRRRR